MILAILSPRAEQLIGAPRHDILRASVADIESVGTLVKGMKHARDH